MKTLIFSLLLSLSLQGHAISPQTGLNGPWHDPTQGSQGMVIHLIPDQNLMFIAWFTYQSTGGQQQWLTASGELSDGVMNLTIYTSQNGAFNSAEPLPEQTTWGTGQLEFLSCTTAKFTYTGISSGTFNLSRITPALNCEEDA